MKKIKLHMVISWSLSILAAVMFALRPSVVRGFCLAGMLLSSCGDMSLAPFDRFIKVFHLHGREFVSGLVFFLLGHICYSVAFITAFIYGELNVFNIGSLAGLIVYIIAIGIMFFLYRTNPKRSGKALFSASLVYLSFICIDCGLAYALGAALGGFGILSLVGGVCFFIGDTLIAVTVIGGRKIKHYDLLEWSFYPIGQLMLILGFALAV